MAKKHPKAKAKKAKKTTRKPAARALKPRRPRRPPRRAPRRATPALDFGGTDGCVLLGAACFQRCAVLLRVNGDDLLRVDSPEGAASTARLTASFHDSKGNVAFRIVENEGAPEPSGWKVEAKGPRLTIRKGRDDPALVLVSEPGAGLRLEQLDLTAPGGVRVILRDLEIVIRHAGAEVRRMLGATTLAGVDCAVEVTTAPGQPPALAIGVGRRRHLITLRGLMPPTRAP